ncbi:hypothetical protein BDB00DRAFT_871528 [Zychaea mexicana]|uniref:uncharacterized protein n=1 Tax=Zychaea mexicana TaxID=64656 RepID=UPI0022FF0A2B|nr:uncharacterized protein BDB00DRAFT_871528 [Zychaea mexicana]KAI9494212.1 hypothetical protein BDB00DRAFT_871528 [Zychaea mexicana]
MKAFSPHSLIHIPMSSNDDAVVPRSPTPSPPPSDDTAIVPDNSYYTSEQSVKYIALRYCTREWLHASRREVADAVGITIATALQIEAEIYKTNDQIRAVCIERGEDPDG